MSAEGANRSLADIPLLSARQDHDSPSVFTPANLLREARRQKGLRDEPVPAICVLDPDGDVADHLRAANRLRRHAEWACYHTILETFQHDGTDIGIIGRVVGAPFATLVAEELFASGCRYLISITSSGQIAPLRKPPYMVLIEKALRDEGTSHHYRPSSQFCHLAPSLRGSILQAWDHSVVPLDIGDSWTTDAPFRETDRMIAMCRDHGILAVEMESAALYALAEAKGYAIVCFAHVTNQMGQAGDDFEKGSAGGASVSLQVLTMAARAWKPS